MTFVEAVRVVVDEWGTDIIDVVRHTKIIAASKKSIPYRTVGALVGDDLQQAIRVNDYGIHRLLIVGCAEMRAAELLQPLLVKLAALPEGIHLVIHLLGIECCKLFPQAFQADSRFDVRHEIEHVYLRRAKSDSFHI